MDICIIDRPFYMATPEHFKTAACERETGGYLNIRRGFCHCFENTMSTHSEISKTARAVPTAHIKTRVKECGPQSVAKIRHEPKLQPPILAYFINLGP